VGRLVSPAHQIASDVGDRSAAGQRHHPSDVGSEEPERMVDPALTADRKTVQVGPPGHAGPGAECHRLHDVAAPADAESSWRPPWLERAMASIPSRAAI
jgi:hypothetical protein